MAHELLLLLIAAALGGAIGFEREIGARPAGFRTHVLVALGAALFTVAGAHAHGGDPTRVAAQVVTGIGFLGAGAIIQDHAGVRGLTTAASLFLTAAVGVACGLDDAGIAALALLLGLIVLSGLKIVERRDFPRRLRHPVLLEIEGRADVKEVVRQAVEVLHSSAVVRRVDRAEEHRTVITLVAALGRDYDLLDLASRLRAIDGIAGVELGQ